MKVAILTDTNSGISVEEAVNSGVFVMSMPVIIEGEIFYEGQNLTEQQFYAALTSDKRITTSQPSPGDLIEKWESLLKEGYDEVVYIPMSSGLSNSCHSAMGFADEYDGKVQVVDNHRISVTLRESVMMAKQLADEGHDGVQIKAALEEDSFHSTIYISVNTLEYLKRGGRITPTAAMIGTVLNIKPILTIQGEKLDSFSKARSMKKCETRMIGAIQSDLENRFPNAKMSDIHIGAAGAGLTDTEQEEWKKKLRNAFPEATVYYDPLSASIGCHTGPGAVGVGVSIIR